MGLEEYRRKRDFAKTPEPAPTKPKRTGKKLSYLVQKHDASRLHYDFRLELDGVLLSWAVTKGPSLNPSDKRLAVRTEDHPLSYGSFEGTIPKGQYGGGTVMLWDQGTWDPESDPHVGLKKGHLSFELHGDRLQGHWDLVRMRTADKRENWLLIKKKDAASNGHSKPGILERSTASVTTGRSMEEIAQGAASRKAASGVKKENPMHARSTTAPSLTKSSVAAGVTITHPERVISEAGHITKGDLAAYYEAVAPFMLPSIVRRPLSLLRCPDGIDGGQCFYQRNPGRGLGKDVQPFEFHHKGKRYEYLYIEDEKGLLEVVQMGAIEIHPWGATIDAIDYPDRMIFDLDPAPDVAFDALKAAAKDLRMHLEKKGLESTVKCSGGKGLHVTVALAAKNRWGEVKTFAAAVANELVTASPDAYVATMSKAKRTGKIFIDYFRNDYTATAIADYSVRAHPPAPVAVPLDWKELPKLTSPSQFTIRDVLQRLKNGKPAAAPKGQVLPSR